MFESIKIMTFFYHFSIYFFKPNNNRIFVPFPVHRNCSCASFIVQWRGEEAAGVAGTRRRGDHQDREGVCARGRVSRRKSLSCPLPVLRVGCALISGNLARRPNTIFFDNLPFPFLLLFHFRFASFTALASFGVSITLSAASSAHGA